ncbi:F-box/LRR-repeat protein At4g14096-like [Lactuca sativa]|uniref:F-box/LRR-repeat protein At4g14096-like n=1 Tax=Lactuca sativa TaxID=4236 RepID=UPI0022B03DD7|nr:F-box/LRR-repeat protein At4g14096-like [Lactuca sativa]
MKSKRLIMSEHKGHEQVEHVNDMVDYISNLPDCILHHILSFMHTQEVVKTSILSTRWKNLWTSIPNIYFDDDLLCPEVTSFKNFVEGVLRSRDSSDIIKFSLSCCVFCDASQIHSWISYAIMHNVQELDLCLMEVDPFVIPSCMFNNKSLEILNIQMHWVELPSHISLPCLKTLHLSIVEFLDDDYAEKLFSGCPVLENLVLSDCMWMYLENILISSPSLKNLIINDKSLFGPLDDFGGCKIKIDAENLTNFEYTGYLSNEILLNNTSYLVKACIHVSPPPIWEKEVACRVVELLKQLQNVISLRLSNCTMEVKFL